LLQSKNRGEKATKYKSHFRKGLVMYFIEIDVRCADQFSEVLPDELEHAELMVEDLVGQILLDLFEEVNVDEVTINWPTHPPIEQPYSSIHIQAHCSSAPLLDSDALEHKELVLEERISYALMELFGTVYVDRVSIRLPPVLMTWDILSLTS
jgi:hypothetical protein